ncbi:hypothetical protein C8Q77DRAFT_1081742 [Trametes polyzona]|nr:hypothetical protein C8Q77DRAFT_1081742 [Trametes polyzona]
MLCFLSLLRISAALISRLPSSSAGVPQYHARRSRMTRGKQPLLCTPDGAHARSHPREAQASCPENRLGDS